MSWGQRDVFGRRGLPLTRDALHEDDLVSGGRGGMAERRGARVVASGCASAPRLRALPTSKEATMVTRPESELSLETREFVRKGLEAMAGQKTGARHASCQSITEARLQELIDRISRARAHADANVAANKPGNESEKGFAERCAEFMRRAEERMTFGLSELRRMRAFHSGTLSNQAGGYEVYSRVRETVLNLHLARDQAAVSAASVRTNPERPRDSSAALDCVRSIGDLLPDLETLGTQGTQCYLSLYYPDI